MNNDIRWKQRFQNFEKAYLLFDEAMQMDGEKLSQLEKEGIIQRFEVLIELSWKTLKDYLENEGYDAVKNAKHVIRVAFQDEIITDAENWMEALKKRNLTSHTYNENILNETMVFLTTVFYPLVRDLYFNLKKEL
jgi:nucleotidyltransferase substrate binding protein (TIGR01987 family)